MSGPVVGSQVLMAHENASQQHPNDHASPKAESALNHDSLELPLSLKPLAREKLLLHRSLFARKPRFLQSKS